MHMKSFVIACLAIVSVTASAQAQGYYGPPPGYGGGYGGGYGRCLSSDGINNRLANSGWYPLANVGTNGPYLYMRVARGPQVRIATVDRCSGRIVQMQPDY